MKNAQSEAEGANCHLIHACEMESTTQSPDLFGVWPCWCICHITQLFWDTTMQSKLTLTPTSVLTLHSYSFSLTIVARACNYRTFSNPRSLNPRNPRLQHSRRSRSNVPWHYNFCTLLQSNVYGLQLSVILFWRLHTILQSDAHHRHLLFIDHHVGCNCSWLQHLPDWSHNFITPLWPWYVMAPATPTIVYDSEKQQHGQLQRGCQSICHLVWLQLIME